MRQILAVAFIFMFSGALFAQTITTYAGGDNIFAQGGQPATAVQLGQPDGVAVDGQGNVYISSLGLAMVLKVSPGGVASVFAGNGLQGGGGDGGLAVGASLSGPGGLAVDQAGNVYIADGLLAVVRKVGTSGIITTVAGNGQGGYSGDGGPAIKAQLQQPTALAVDNAGNLYIADNADYIRQVSPNGTISTVAGNGAGGYTGDGGPATKAGLNRPAGLAVDAAGNVYVADQFACAVRRFKPGGSISTVAGGHCGFSGSGGPATQAAIGFVEGVAIDSSGSLYISDNSSACIWRVTSGTITIIAGNGKTGFSGDGSSALQAMFSSPGQLAIDPSGAVIVVDGGNNRARRVVPGGSVATIAGENFSIGDGGPSTLAIFTFVGGVATDAAGNLYVPDVSQNRVRKVAPSGIITTVAGTGTAGSSGDGGPATSANVGGPNGVAVDAAGNLFIASGNSIRRVDAATGIISTFAGQGNNCCYGGNGTGGDGGPAAEATLYFPTNVAVDANENVYFIDLVLLSNGITQGARVRRVTPDGIVNVYAGGGYGFGGDGGPATKALFGNDINIALGPDGSLYIADVNNNVVRRVDPATGIINTVAGNGKNASAGDGGPATSASVSVASVAIDKANNLYIGGVPDVRKVTPGGVISTYAGNGVFLTAGDGEPAQDASIGVAGSLTTDAAGNLYIAEGRRVRIVQTVTPAIAVAPVSLSFTSTGATSQTVAISNGAKNGKLNWAASTSTASGGAWLSVSPSSGSSVAGQAGTPLTVTIQANGLAAGDFYGQILVSSPNAGNPVEEVTVRLTVGTPGPAPPQVGGVVSTATYTPNLAVAPGTIVAIFGSNMTEAGQIFGSSSFPLPRQLGGTSVTIGGELMPLIIVTPGQINAIVPYDLPVNSNLPLVVTHNNAISPPEPVSLAADAPGLFTVAQNGAGTAVVVIVHPDGSQVHAGAGNAATAGDVLVIYGTGFGGVNPAGVAGAPAQPQPLAQVDAPVTVTIGGVSVPVSFAGPTPGSTGLYQVNVTVPAGIAPSAAAPLILTQGGRSSRSDATIPIQ